MLRHGSEGRPGHSEVHARSILEPSGAVNPGNEGQMIHTHVMASVRQPFHNLMDAGGSDGYQHLTIASDGIGERFVARWNLERADYGGMHKEFPYSPTEEL
jgi:hypothetical protein